MLSTSQRPLGLRFDTKEAFAEGKNREKTGGGDRIVQGIRYVGIVDAASEKNRSNRWNYSGNILTGEALLATMLSEKLAATRDDLLFALQSVQEEVCAIALRCGIDLANPVNRPQAQLAVLDLVKGRILRLGDCTFATVRNGTLSVSANPKRVDELMAKERIEHIRPLIRAGTYDPAADSGRNKILPLFADCIDLANRDPAEFRQDEHFLGMPKQQLVYRCFDPRGDLKVEEHPLPDDVDEVIFASDGYQKVYGDFWETELSHARAILLDPHGIHPPSTKGMLPGSTGPDDRSYLRLVIDKAARLENPCQS